MGRLDDADLECVTEIDGVQLMRVEATTGWVVCSGCEGNDPRFVAFFSARPCAEAYINAIRIGYHDGDLQAAPAVVIDGVIVIGDHYDDEKCVEALIKLAGLSDGNAQPFRDEARGQ